MAVWNDVHTYVRNNYKVADEQPGVIKMIFDVGNLRSQVVFLARQTLMNETEEWLLIESPFGELGNVDLPKVLKEVGDTVCGGLGLVAGHILTIRHAVPLINLDINELERPLILVTATADRLERQFVGGDEF
jgi:hypothetical protein